MKKLLCAALLFLSPHSNATPEVNNSSTSYPTIEISNSLTSVERKVRDASVRVVTSRGHGSGSLIKYRDVHLVLTAHHVADGALGSRYLITTDHDSQMGVLVYKDPLNDIALIYVPVELRHATPMRWNPREELVNIGAEITYSGYPSWHSLMSFRGHVAGVEVLPEGGTQIILQTYGYFGCSGAVVYDTSGRIIGILWGVDQQRNTVQENIVWVSPIQNLDIDLALSALCGSMPEKPRACS